MPSLDSCSAIPSASKPFSLSFSSKPQSKNRPITNITSNLKKRPHSALAEPESDEESNQAVRAESVSGFDAGNAIISDGAVKNHAPLIIKSEKNRDWREESRRKRGKNSLPAEAQAAQDRKTDVQSHVERSEVLLEGGLKFITAEARRTSDGTSVTEEQASMQIEKPIVTADEEALAALLGAKKESTFTIPTQDTDTHADGQDPMLQVEYATEDDRFRADLASRPEPASLSDYDAVPIEEFGPAMLRGMGWTEGAPIGKRKDTVKQKPREVKKRPALLGIGAKEVPGGGEELDLGAWGGLRGRGKEKVLYNPVALRNSVTGEVITEEEKRMRDSQAKNGEKKTTNGERSKDEGWQERRDRNLVKDQEMKRKRLLPPERHETSFSRQDEGRDQARDRRRDAHDDHQSLRTRSRSADRNRHGASHRERSRDPERSRHGSSRRERSRSMGRKHRRRDHESERDYRRREDGRRR